MESKHWLDWTKWKLIKVQLLQTMTNEEDAENLGYSEVNLFDEMDQEPQNEYMDMEMTMNTNEGQDLEGWTNGKSFGLAATDNKGKGNLNPTIQEAMAGPDKRLWEEAM